MHYIALDTNTWIYLANGTEPVKLLHFIKDEVEKENITVLLPQTILNEWENHKDKTVRKGSVKHFNDINNALEQILKLLGDRAKKNIRDFFKEEKENYFEDFVQDFKVKKNEIEKAVSDNIKLIDELFKQKAIVVTHEDRHFVKSGNYAIEKKKPFGGKNSFADALILFSFLDYVKLNDIEGAFFISYNTEDFCKRENGKKKLHTDLIEEFNESKALFFKTVGEALRTIKEDIISKEELDLIEEEMDIDYQSSNFHYCNICADNGNRQNKIHFVEPKELKDERVVPANIQTSYNYFPSLTHLNDNQTIEIGYCSVCDSQHFICIGCDSLNPVWEIDLNERIDCNGCNEEYIIKAKQDSYGYHSFEYILPRIKDHCEKCGQDFNIEDLIAGRCADCIVESLKI